MGDTDTWTARPGSEPHTFRGLAYRLAEVSPSGVRVLHTERQYMATVTV